MRGLKQPQVRQHFMHRFTVYRQFDYVVIDDRFILCKLCINVQGLVSNLNVYKRSSVNLKGGGTRDFE